MSQQNGSTSKYAQIVHQKGSKISLALLVAALASHALLIPIFIKEMRQGSMH